MVPWKLLAGVAGVGLAGAGVAAAGLSRRRWRGETARRREALVVGPVAGRGAVELPAGAVALGPADHLDSLPEPVAAYLRRSIAPDRPPVVSWSLLQRGEFFLAGRWRPFEAVHHGAARPPGFLWDARIRLGPGLFPGLVPGLVAWVRDGYRAGHGSLEASLAGVLPLANASPCRELAEASLQRHLAEAAWAPTILVPGEESEGEAGVSWQAIDASTARATLTDPVAGSEPVAVSVETTFDDAGDLVSVHAPGRWREVDGRFEATPWTGRFWDHAERDGLRVPLAGEVEWVLPEGPRPYWRARIEEITFRP